MKSLFRYDAGKTEFTAWEWLVMRVLFAAALYFSFRLAGYDAVHWFSSPGRSGWQVTVPRGLALFVDVNWIVDPGKIPWLAASICLGLTLLILGRFLLLGAGLLLVVKTLIGTLENSASNNIFHTSQILCFGLMGIVLGSLYSHIAAWRAGKWLPITVTAEARSRIIYTVQQMVAAAYVVAGISKLWRSKGQWVAQSDNIHLQFIKNQKQDFYTTLIPPDGMNWAVDFVMHHNFLARAVLAGGLVLELGCFLALWNRQASLLWGLGLIAMHLMISQIMGLNFDLNVQMLFIFFVNLGWWSQALRNKWNLRPVQS